MAKGIVSQTLDDITNVLQMNRAITLIGAVVLFILGIALGISSMVLFAGIFLGISVTKNRSEVKNDG